MRRCLQRCIFDWVQQVARERSNEGYVQERNVCRKRVAKIDVLVRARAISASSTSNPIASFMRAWESFTRLGNETALTADIETLRIAVDDQTPIYDDKRDESPEFTARVLSETLIYRKAIVACRDR